MYVDTQIAEAVRCLEREFHRTLDAQQLAAVEAELRSADRRHRKAGIDAVLQKVITALRDAFAPMPRARRGRKAASVWPA